ncbi:MAG: tRNA (adenosine(37)-N6)-threonylcarbamoyltransferase complex transferase subunit TsaD [Verrucomicrobiota bacterium]
MKVIGIETSCDETSVALLDFDENQQLPKILHQEVSSQIKIHQPYGGVVPELATRQHLIHLRPMIHKVLERAQTKWHHIDLIGVTRGPGLASSLMIGLSFAKACAIASEIPWLGINHLEGHLVSAFLSHNSVPIYPHLGLIISGGHTQIIHVKALSDYELIGSTRDDAAGEAFDKVAKMLDLPYPGGPVVEELARNGDASSISFPRAMINKPNYSFSFSGLKTAVKLYLDENPHWTHDKQHLSNICASFQQAVIDVLIHKTFKAAQELNLTTVSLSGGVSCNQAIRQTFAEEASRKGIKCVLAAPYLSTDNASMIALVAALQHQQGVLQKWDTDIDPNLKLAS